MVDLGRVFWLPLGVSELSGAGCRMIGILGAAGLAASVGGSIIGGIGARRAAKKALRENRYRTNAEKAWYEKEYNTDYLDTKAGQNLLRRAQEVQDSYIRKADGAAAVGGGTAASAALAKESANRTVGNAVANIGAQDTARKASVSDQHQRNVDALSREREAIYNQQAQNVSAAAQGMSNAMMGAVPSLDGAPDVNAEASKIPTTIDVTSPHVKAAGGGSLLENEVRKSKWSDKLKNVTGV